MSNSQKIHPILPVTGHHRAFFRTASAESRTWREGLRHRGNGPHRGVKGLFLGGRKRRPSGSLFLNGACSCRGRPCGAQVSGPFSRAGRRAEGRRSLLRRGFGARRPSAARLFVTKAVFPLTGEGGVLNNEKNFRYFLQQLSSGM